MLILWRVRKFILNCIIFSKTFSSLSEKHSVSSVTTCFNRFTSCASRLRSKCFASIKEYVGCMAFVGCQYIDLRKMFRLIEDLNL
jgi:hypothetical protein